MNDMIENVGTDGDAGAGTADPAKASGAIVNGGDGGSIATGQEAPPLEAEKPYWPEDWKTRFADQFSAGDEKIRAKELKRLERMTSPSEVWASYRAMENTWATKNFVKLPGADAKPEDVAEFNKALGVPETPDGYLKDLKLDNGLVLGDDDKPVAEAFAESMHKVGAPPAAVKAALNWYLKTQEEHAAALDQSDDSFRRTSEQALKNEYGNAFKRYTGNIASLFSTAPGGSDVSNPDGVYARLMGGRTADGQLIGNDPDVVRWLVSVANNVNPAGMVVEDGVGGGGAGIDEEISALEQRMKADRTAYFKDEKAQARYRELLTARDKIRAKAR